MTTQAFVAEAAISLTPDNDNKIGTKLYGFRVNVGGDVRFLDGKGNEHTWYIPDGGREPIEITKLFATGTTAQGISGYVR